MCRPYNSVYLPESMSADVWSSCSRYSICTPTLAGGGEDKDEVVVDDPGTPALVLMRDFSQFIGPVPFGVGAAGGWLASVSTNPLGNSSPLLYHDGDD